MSTLFTGALGHCSDIPLRVAVGAVLLFFMFSLEFANIRLYKWKVFKGIQSILTESRLNISLLFKPEEINYISHSVTMWKKDWNRFSLASLILADFAAQTLNVSFLEKRCKCSDCTNYELNLIKAEV